MRAVQPPSEFVRRIAELAAAAAAAALWSQIAKLAERARAPSREPFPPLVLSASDYVSQPAASSSLPLLPLCARLSWRISMRARKVMVIAALYVRHAWGEEEEEERERPRPLGPGLGDPLSNTSHGVTCPLDSW